jgi:uncharacterized repeat protein (TIGR03803 family)
MGRATGTHISSKEDNQMYGKQVFRIIIAILAIMGLTLVLGSSAWATEHKTLHKFKLTGGGGSVPYGGVILDAASNLYGTTRDGGAYGVGTVFELRPNGDGSWTESVLHSFNGSDGANPVAGLIFDAAGSLYGTTQYGGSVSACGTQGCGTVFELTPNGDGSWTERVLHSFEGRDGAGPFAGLIFDAAGNLYGTTKYGGAHPWGTVFELTPNGDGSWTESVLHSFKAYDGAYPVAGLTFDTAGNLYGTTLGGGANGKGTVFELTPNGDGSWGESVLHSFSHYHRDGQYPEAGVTFDAAGNLYGTAVQSVAKYYRGGTVFQLTPNGDGSWTESVLHSFNGRDGAGPYGDLTFDAAGNLYGTTNSGGAVCGCGAVFKLTPNGDGSWTERGLHKFKNHPSAYPQAGLVLDQAGNLYGTTVGDGTTTFGSVFEITPNTAAQDSE